MERHVRPPIVRAIKDSSTTSESGRLSTDRPSSPRRADAVRNADRMDHDATRRKLRSARFLEASGIAASRLRTRLVNGDLHRIHRGWYVDGPAWADAYAEERHLMEVFAATEAMRGADVVVVRVSAGVMWELPLWRHRPKNVHVAGVGGDGSATTDGPVARHRSEIPREHRTALFGIACTTRERTVVDLACTTRLETAVAAADAAMRQIAWDPVAREYDASAADAFRTGLHAVIGARAGARGIRRARFVADFADGRAESPLESVSSVYFSALGFVPPRLQVPLPGPNRERLRVEFGLDEFDAWGECDGDGKYHDRSQNGGRTAEQVFAAEKRREDWIRATTGRRFVRWGASDLTDLDTFEAFLRRRGLVSRHPWRPMPW